jgi:5-methylcytosine-specific restriction protein B
MSSYDTFRNQKSLLAAAATWGRECLLGNGSILASGQELWTAAHLAELDVHFVQNYDDGEGTFLSKLEVQLGEVSPEARRLMAEVLWLHFLFTVAVSAGKKREIIGTLWGWSGLALDMDQPPLSDEALCGSVNPGTAYNTHRHAEVTYLIGVMQAFKRLGDAGRREALSDPWVFSRWLAGAPHKGNRQSRHALRYLLFPDTFERSSTTTDKQRLVAHFDRVPAGELKKWDDEQLDRALLAIRQRLEGEAGGPVDFYEATLKAQWQEPAAVASTSKTWLLLWNPKNWHWQDLAENRVAAANGLPVVHSWRCASSAAKIGDAALLVRFGVPPRGLVARGTITAAPYEAPHYDKERAEAGDKTTFVDVSFSAIRDAEQDLMVSMEALQNAAPEQTWSPQSSGIQVKPEAAAKALALWEALPPVTISGVLVDTADSSSGEVLSISEPTNRIFYGPPGTGKTHRLLSAYIGFYQDEGALPEARRFEFVTFHQSYSYEDFVEGIRPAVLDGNVTYEVRHGVFRRLCERARRDPGRRYAIFIDEINRGNVAKILGELITLLEPDKRAVYDRSGRYLHGLELTLPYSGDLFGVPRNLDVYGTMNTADRSVSLLDAALRRRFQFEELMPTPDAIVGTDDKGCIPDEEGGEISLRHLLKVLNERLTHLLHRDQTIGHAYFIKVQDFPTLQRVLAREVVPLLQEYFYEDWDRIRSVLADDTGVDVEQQLVRRVTVRPSDLFPGTRNTDLGEGVRYAVAAEAEITSDAVRKIYEAPV